MYQLAKYATATTIYFSMIKAGSNDLAQSADWTPATGDTKVSINGGTLANTTNNPAIVAGTNGVLWSLALTTGELTGADIRIQIVDSATKAVEDQSLTVYTYGHASAKLVADFSVAALAANVTQLGGDAQSATDLKDFADAGYDPATNKVQGVVLTDTTTTATNLTNAPTAGDFTATMKTSIGTAVAASAVASVTGNVGGNVTGSVGSVATGGITSASIATGAIDADALATDAINEIADAVWDELQSGHVGAGSFGEIATEIADILADTADMQPKLGTPAGASVSADIAAVKAQAAAIEADTQDLQTQIGTDGAGLTNMPWNTAWDAEVQSECADAITAAALATAAELAKVPKSDSTVTWNATALASINSEVDTAIADAAFMFGQHASGTLSGTHSSTTADLGTAAPSGDISGFVLYIPSRTFIKFVDSYNTGTGVATFETTSATLTNGDPWYLFAQPAASTTNPLPVDVQKWSGTTVATPDTVGYPKVTIKDGTGAGEIALTSGAIDTVAAVTTVNGLANDVITAASIAAGAGNEIADTILTRQMTESYAADGTAPTLAQAIFLIQQSIGDFSISGTTLTVKQLNGSTTAATYTLDSSTAPTSRTRAS